MRRITFVPVGGLANRMRAMVSALTLAHQTDSKLEVIWFPTWDLYAPFDSLFLPIDESGISLRNASIWDKLTLDRPRKKIYIFLDCINALLSMERNTNVLSIRLFNKSLILMNGSS